MKIGRFFKLLWKKNPEAFLLWVSNGVCIPLIPLWNGAVYMWLFFAVWLGLWLTDPFKLKRFDSQECLSKLSEKEVID